MNETRARLEAERRRLLESITTRDAEVAAIVAAREGSNVDDEHDPEGATIAFERSQADASVVRARNRLVAVEVALQRLADGTHGTCERCRGPIGDERLEALPATRRCVSCAALG